MLIRGVAWLLAVVLFVVAPGLMVLPASVAADRVVEDVVSFADVPESSLFHKEISWLASEGISTGWDVGGGKRQYRPLDSIARDAMAAFLYRKAGSPAYTPPGTSPFTDVTPGAAFYKEITWLASKGISTGWDLGGGKREYRPLSPIARDAMAAFLFRFAQPPQFTEPLQSPFVDVAAGGAFYREITWLASSGISTGWDIGGGAREYRPLNGIARDAMAAFLYRYASEKVLTNPLDPAAGTVTVAPDVEILDAVQLDTALVSGGALTLPSNEAAEINANDVLVAGVTAGTPEGLLARVVQVSRDPGGSTVVKLKPATLTEAIVSTSGLLEFAGIPVSSTFTPEPDVTVTTPQSDAVPFSGMAQPEALTGEVFSKSFSLKRTIRSEVGTDELHGNGSIALESSIRASAKAKMTLEAGFLQLKEASVVLTPSFSSKHSVSVSGTLEGTASAKLGVLKAVLVFPTAIPIVVTAEAEVAVNLTAAGAAEISYVTAHTVSSDFGFKYREGSFNLVNTKPQATGVQDEVQATASLTARLALDFDADIRLYGIAGITFGAGPYASAPITVVTSNGTQSWSCPIEVGFEARLGVVAGIEVMGFKFENSSGTSAAWKLLEVNPCEGTPVVGPSPAPGSPVIATQSLPSGTVGQAYQATMTATGGVPPYSWSVVQGALPSGLQINSASGFIAGLPSNATESQFTVRVTDARNATNSLTMSISILPPDDATSGLSGVLKTVTDSSATFALKRDGTVWAWGENYNGRLGTADPESATKPLPTQVVNMRDVADIYIPYNWSGATFARKNDGTLWAWGTHASGLGNGSFYSNVPVQVRGVSSARDFDGNGQNFFVVNTDGTVSGWGKNTGSLLGGTQSTLDYPQKISGLSNIHQVTSDGMSAFAVDMNGTVYSWGFDSRGVLGNGDLCNSAVPTAIQGLPKIKSVVFDKFLLAAFAIAFDGTLWTWGNKVGNSTASYTQNPEQVPEIQNVKDLVSQYNAYAILDDGTLWSWGNNYYGQLGLGSYAASSTPQRVPGIPSVRSLTTDGYHVVAAASDGQLFWWGNRDQRNITSTHSGQTSPVSFDSPTNALSVTNTFSHYGRPHSPVYATTVDGKVWAWGDNSQGELGNGSTVASLVPLQVGVVH